MRSLLLAPLLLLPVLLSGCAAPDTDVAGTRSPTSSAAATRSSSPATATATATGAAPAGGSGGDAAPVATTTPASGCGLPTTRSCGGPDLEIALHATDSGAGSTDYAIAFTNRGRAACHVSGAPRAYLIDERGDPLGADATGTGQEGGFVRVPPGESAYTDMRVVDVGTDGGPLVGRCTTRKAVAIAIDAPNHDRYEQVPVTARGCEETDVSALSVGVLRSGS